VIFTESHRRPLTFLRGAQNRIGFALLLFQNTKFGSKRTIGLFPAAPPLNAESRFLTRPSLKFGRHNGGLPLKSGKTDSKRLMALNRSEKLVSINPNWRRITDKK
jgi:hypothetical protein